MQYSGKFKDKKEYLPSKEYLITIRISRPEYDILCLLGKLKKLNKSQTIRFAISKLKDLLKNNK